MRSCFRPLDTPSACAQAGRALFGLLCPRAFASAAHDLINMRLNSIDGHQTNASIVAHVVVIWHVAKRDARPRQSRHLILVTSTDRRADCRVVPCWSFVRGPRCWRDHADRRNKTKQQTNSNCNSNSTNEIHSTGAGGGNSAVARDQNDWHC